MFRKEKVPYIIGTVIVLIILLVLMQKLKSPEPSLVTAAKTAESVPNLEETKKMTDSDKPIVKDEKPVELVIDVKGAVKKPGVYHMTDGERIVDAIGEAGGFADKADQKQINMAQKLADEMVVYVPVVGEDTPPVTGSPTVTNTTASRQTEGGQVNLNSATLEDLQELPGIGPAKAQAILTYREEKGSFQSVDDLLNVTGIGEKSLEKIKPAATVK